MTTQEIISLIPEEEQKKILSYIDTYVVPSSDLSGRTYSNVYTLLDPWAQAKNEGLLLKAFDNKLIVEKDFCYEGSYDEMYDMFYEKLFSSPKWAFFRDKVIEARDIALSKIGDISRDYTVVSIVFSELVKRNVVMGEEEISFDCTIFNPLDPEHPLKISPKTKIMKTLKKISDAYSFSEEYEEVRILHSQVLNQKKLKGTLCLSIHPLDYMTMSDNASGWESCMSWTNDGCYRLGTVEMMNSPYVVVAYLKSEKRPFYIDNFSTWNNKKWRTLYIVTKDCISEIKSYPYRNDDLSLKGISLLKEMVEKTFPTIHYGEPVLKDYDKIREDFDFRVNYMYNDFNGDECYKRFFCAALETSETRPIKIVYSGKTQCMICGRVEGEIYFEDADTLICSDCSDEPTTYCECCGEPIYDRDDIYYDENDLPYCEHCANNHLYEDDLFGNTRYFETFSEMVGERRIVVLYNDELQDEDDKNFYLDRFVPTCYQCFSRDAEYAFSEVFEVDFDEEEFDSFFLSKYLDLGEAPVFVIKMSVAKKVLPWLSSRVAEAVDRTKFFVSSKFTPVHKELTF